MAMPTGVGPLLAISDLRTHFTTEHGVVKAVDGVSLHVDAGKTLGIVGESGCGKTVLALSLLRLLPPPGRIVGGQVLFKGRDLLALTEEEMRQIRGREISMIFQEPMTSLNPVFRVGDQIAEVLRFHQGLGSRDASEKSVALLRRVGMSSPELRVRDYPHQMSGGMRQRVMIAMAIACKPRLILADEPTTALDVTIQAQILETVRDLQAKTGTAVLLITHNLGVIAEAAQDVAVMYAGQIVERCPVGEIFATPLHPYTKGLLASVPRMDGPAGRDAFIQDIPGSVPPLYNLPAGCRFQDRCSERLSVCSEGNPTLGDPWEGHQVRCWKYARG